MLFVLSFSNTHYAEVRSSSLRYFLFKIPDLMYQVCLDSQS